MNNHVEFLVALRDASQQLANAADNYIQSLAPPEIAETTANLELTFTTLTYEAQRGAKLGDFEIAHKSVNLQDKWHAAYNILRSNNATINERYYGDDYQHSYWLYGSDRIYRQKLKPK